MKVVLNTVLKTMFTIVIISVTTITVNAQFNIGGPGTSGSGINGNGTTNGSPSPEVPFDGVMSLMLLASGVGYCAKKLRKK